MQRTRGVRRVAILVAASGALWASTAIAANGGANWTSSGHDFNNTRYNETERVIGVDNVGSLGVDWHVATEGDVSATPAVDGTAVYFPDFAGNVYAVDRMSGEVLWQKNLVTDYGLPAGDHARATPAIAGDLLIFGDQLGKTSPFVDHGNILAVDRHTGDIVWMTSFPDVQPIVTQAAVVRGDVAYVGVASYEELWARFLPPEACCRFRGNVMALDVATGQILARTYLTPEPDPADPNDGYTGAAVWGSGPVIDPKRNSLYITTGNNYSVPSALQACVDSGGTPESCVDPNNHFDSIVALDLDTLAIKWATKAIPSDAWNVSCGIPYILEGETENCPDEPGPDYDFGQGPALFTTGTGSQRREFLGAGQKSGQYWALDPATGAVQWETQVSPGGLAGGLQWGSAVDGKRVYVANSNASFLPWAQVGGGTVNYGGWSALDAATGEILWTTPNPGESNGMGPVSGANGVIYACSMDAEGLMVAMDAATGAILWSFASGASCLGGAAISQGQVFWGYGYDAFSAAGPQPDQGLYAFGLPG